MVRHRHRLQVRAAVVVHHALRTARRAAAVEHSRTETLVGDRGGRLSLQRIGHRHVAGCRAPDDGHVDVTASNVAQPGEPQRFDDVPGEWSGDKVTLKRSGVEAQLEVDERRVKVDVKLGMLMSAMSGMIQSEIERSLDKALA